MYEWAYFQDVNALITCVTKVVKAQLGLEFARPGTSNEGAVGKTRGNGEQSLSKE